MSKKHTDLVNEILLLISIPGIRAWSNQTGVARSMDGLRIIKYGMKGSADILGIMKCKSGVGAFLAIECKIGNDDLRKQQINFQNMIRAHGGLYIKSYDSDVLSEIQTFILNN
jgi:hypothetical protein